MKKEDASFGCVLFFCIFVASKTNKTFMRTNMVFWRTNKNFSLLLLVFSLLLPQSFFAQPGFGKATLFNEGWQFKLETEPEWRQVTLPHDWSVDYTPSDTLYSCTGYLPGGIGHYRKMFALEPTELHRQFIYFEGVYNRSKVYLNGQLLGSRPSGYASFCYELTPYLKAGGNMLEVEVDHSRQADSRWYTGSGIWRDVYIVDAPDVHLALWGTTYRLTKLEGTKAEVQVDVTVDNLPTQASERKLYKIAACLIDVDGKQVAYTTKYVNNTENVSVTLSVNDAHLWDLNDPYLYTLQVLLLKDGVWSDRMECKAGLRTLRFDANEGFFLNEVNRKVKGVCLHHDAGVLGAAVPEEVWRWRLVQLKELGCNAIRCSHNPQTPILYDLCDEMGFLVMDEASDEWEFPKRKWLKGWNKGEPGYEGTYDFFEEWIERDVADMVRRDRNHPCVFLWSIGNEVDYPNDPYSHPVLDGSSINQPMYGGYKPDAPDAMRIGEIAKRLVAVVKANDSSRPVTGALAGVVMSNETAYPQAVDVVGYNYTENRYEQDHAAYPERVIYGSENGHGYEQWLAVRDNPYIFGQFIWTGIDYLGESGAWPSRGMGTGLLDFCGFPKFQAQMRKTMWAQQPGDTLSMNWMRQRGGQRRRGMGQDNPVPVELPTPVGLRMAILNDSLPIIDHHKDGSMRTLLVLVELVDEQGKRCERANNPVSCVIEGPASLLGIESGNNMDMSAPHAKERKAWQGRVLAYIQVPTKARGISSVTFSSPDVGSSVIQIR